jgi:anti-anti-sigma regulatory factor
MTLRIEKTLDGKHTTIRLIGRMCHEHVGELKSLIEDSTPGVVLDLDELTHVDVDAVNFLRECQAEGIKLRHCSPYIREWIHREQDREG